MSNERRAAVAIIRQGDRALLIRRKMFDGDPWAGHIAFPGGHVHNNETIEQGLLREVLEEVSLEFSESQIKGKMEPFHPFRVPEMMVYPMIIDTDSFSRARKGPEVEDIKIVDLRNYVESRHPENGFPALNYEGWLVWGLTYRIIRSYLESLK